MSLIRNCISLEPSGGSAPYTIDVSALIDSSGQTSQIDVSYCINAGPPQGLQTMTFTPGPVTGYAYTVSIPGVMSGDIVEIKTEATVSTNVGDMGTLIISGTGMQTDADGCAKEFTFSEACDWTAIDGTAVPTCPADAAVDCTLLPYASGAFANATSITQSGLDLSVYNFTSTTTGYVIGLNIGQTPIPQTVTITATNANGSCTQTLTVTCTSNQVSLIGSCGTIPGSATPPDFEPEIQCGVGSDPGLGAAGGQICGKNITQFTISDDVDEVTLCLTGATGTGDFIDITIAGVTLTSVSATFSGGCYVWPAISNGLSATDVQGSFTISFTC